MLRDETIERVLRFRDDRDWRQFHTPKDLAISMSLEAAELLAAEGISARVVDMRAVVGNVGGHKRPKTDTSFLVTFLTDDGERMEYPVPEELYVTLNIDQTGTLVILNDGFFDFGDGEEMEENRDAEGI